MNFGQRLRHLKETAFFKEEGPEGLIRVALPDLLFRRSSFKTRSKDNRHIVDNITIVERDICDDWITITLHDVEWSIAGKAHSGSASVYGDVVNNREIVLKNDQANAHQAALLIADHIDKTAKDRWEAEARLVSLYENEVVGNLIRQECRNDSLQIASKRLA